MHASLSVQDWSKQFLSATSGLPVAPFPSSSSAKDFGHKSTGRGLAQACAPCSETACVHCIKLAKVTSLPKDHRDGGARDVKLLAKPSNAFGRLLRINTLLSKER